MADEFSQFGGIQAEDEFSQFGDTVDEFAQFGGTPQQSPNVLEEMTYADVRRIIDRPYFDAPAVDSENVTDAEINAIARQHKLDPALVKEMSPYFGALGQGTTAEELESSLGRGVGFNVPQFIAKKSIDDPAVRAALDDIQDLADAKRSFSRGIAENIIPVGMLGRLVTGAGKAAASGTAKQLIARTAAETAGTGAVASGARSREGEELQSTATGVALGVVLGGALGGVVARLSRGAAPEEARMIERAIADDIPQIEDGARAIRSARQRTDDLVGDIILNPESPDKGVSPRLDRVSIVREQLSPGEFEKYLDENTEQGWIMRRMLTEEKPGVLQEKGLRLAVADELMDGMVERQAIDFAEHVNPRYGKAITNLDEARAAIRATRESPEQLRRNWNQFRDEAAALDYIRSRDISETAGEGFGRRAANFVSDNQTVLRDMDSRYGGIGAESALARINRGLNLATGPRNVVRSDIDKLVRANKAVDSDMMNESGGRIARAIDSGDTSGLSAAETQAVNGTRTFLDGFYKYITGGISSETNGRVAPLSFPRRENYLPHMLADTDTLNARMQSALREALPNRRLSDLSPEELASLRKANNKLDEVIRSLEFINGGRLESPREAARLFKETFVQPTSTGRDRMESVARSAMERTADMPSLLREWRVPIILDKYASNMIRHAYMRDGMRELSSVARKLRAAGGEAEAVYIDNLLRDIVGIRRGTASEMALRMRSAFHNRVDRVVPDGITNRAIKAVPDIMGDMTKFVYSNLLGMNPKSLIMNAIQPIVKTAPELGGTYGYGALTRGYLHTLLNLPTQLKRVRSLGFAPDQFVGKYRRAVATGIRRNSLYSMTMETATKLADAALYLYTRTDSLNRAVALSTAEIMAADLIRGSAAAQKSLTKFPGYIQRAIRNTPQDKWGLILGEYLNDATQYVYNRASMSEYGRVMGPLFSTFTKWPTATAGEIIEAYRRGGVSSGSRRVMEKFVAPMILLQLLDSAILGERFGEDAEPLTARQKVFVGASGLSGSSPLGSIRPLLTGDFFHPPVIDALMSGLVVPAINGDPAELMRGVDSAIYNFTPGTTYIRFVTDTLPTIIEGERPEGSTFIERTPEGARRMDRILGK